MSSRPTSAPCTTGSLGARGECYGKWHPAPRWALPHCMRVTITTPIGRLVLQARLVRESLMLGLSSEHESRWTCAVAER
eukprot:13763978-Alexandrium_andersonii.AAC.1